MAVPNAEGGGIRTLAVGAAIASLVPSLRELDLETAAPFESAA